MTEYIPYILAALPILFVVGWYCRRWGLADGYAEGYIAGQAAGADVSKTGAPLRPVAPDLSGGPRERA